MVHFSGEEANESAVRLMREAHVGGFIYYNWSNALHSPEQVRRLSQSLQLLSHKVPLLIAIDQEGGRVTRLNQGFTKPPPNSWIATPEEAKRWAETVGKELRAVGITMNLAPVVDVNSNPNNPVIGNRAFSTNPWDVIRLGSAAVQGYLNAGVIPVLKHFPGHGDTATDSHTSLPRIDKTRDALEACELLPFRRLALEAPAIMTAHLLIPALDPKTCASLSPTIITGLLRHEMHFQGVIISDSLVMQGLLHCCPSVAEASIQALAAGTDLLILGGRQLVGEDTACELSVDEMIEVHHSIVEAVRTHRLSEAAIDASVTRILSLKERR